MRLSSSGSLSLQCRAPRSARSRPAPRAAELQKPQEADDLDLFSIQGIGVHARAPVNRSAQGSCLRTRRMDLAEVVDSREDLPPHLDGRTFGNLRFVIGIMNATVCKLLAVRIAHRQTGTSRWRPDGSAGSLSSWPPGFSVDRWERTFYEMFAIFIYYYKVSMRRGLVLKTLSPVERKLHSPRL